eukprot:363545-Chlamydomonas_euryale.AAC.14
MRVAPLGAGPWRQHRLHRCAVVSHARLDTAGGHAAQASSIQPSHVGPCIATAAVAAAAAAAAALGLATAVAAGT